MYWIWFLTIKKNIPIKKMKGILSLKSYMFILRMSTKKHTVDKKVS